jgi:hypothetical protein
MSASSERIPGKLACCPVRFAAADMKVAKAVGKLGGKRWIADHDGCQGECDCDLEEMTS